MPGSLWRECAQGAVFDGLDDARRRIGLYIDYYNFHRPHQGLDGLVPADRYFEAAPEVRETLLARVSGNALDLARHGEPRQNFYLTGRVGDEGISLHGEGGKVVLTRTDGTREEVDLLATGRRAAPGGTVESVRPEAAGESNVPAPSIVPKEPSVPAAPSAPSCIPPECVVADPIPPAAPSAQAEPPPDETGDPEGGAR